MIIEVRGTGVHNKGAELMFCAIREYFHRLDPSIQCAVNPQFGAFADRARYGLLTLVTPKGLRRSSLSIRLMSSSFRRTYGLVVEDEVDAVLDASGFAFGDQWGSGPVESVAGKAERFRDSGRPYILMPQAFGPFNDPRVAAGCKRLIEAATLTFVRDRESLDHVTRIVGESDKIKLAPDFTCLVAGRVPEDIELPERFACLVPNIRMLDRTSSEESAAYIGFLAACATELMAREVEPVWVFHDLKNDRRIADAVDLELGRNLTRIEQTRPEALKGILGQSALVVGSRFHALAGALLCNVSCITAGWSHKYQELFREYGCESMVLASTRSRQELCMSIERALAPDSRSELIADLQQRNLVVHRKVDEMMRETATTIGVHLPRPSATTAALSAAPA